ncbi:MAG TPA: Spy/CpxP family protein refolding chaperone [Acidobacteriaceae bacterium]|nr:Spy/CpxP family protein refolding chaperone [Acidobacteriaceae bacterium]
MRSTMWTGAVPAALLACFLGLPRAEAQHGGGGHGGGMPGGGLSSSGFGGGYGNGMGNRDNGGPPPGRAPESAGTTSAMRGGLQLGPPGRWWDDKHFAKDLKLRPDQQRRMDGIFEANRASLIRRLEDSHQEETRLESLVHSKNLDETALSAQIDRVWQARAELEKAYTHYLLQIRNEMDADQVSRLEEHR